MWSSFIRGGRPCGVPSFLRSLWPSVWSSFVRGGRLCGVLSSVVAVCVEFHRPCVVPSSVRPSPLFDRWQQCAKRTPRPNKYNLFARLAYFKSATPASFTYFGEVLSCPHKSIVTITKLYIAINNRHVKIIRFHTN